MAKEVVPATVGDIYTAVLIIIIAVAGLVFSSKIAVTEDINQLNQKVDRIEKILTPGG